jgi:hypothetical protein
LTSLFFIAKLLEGNDWFMAVKLAVLKSGEDVVADIKELCDENDNVVALVFNNPVVVKLITNQALLDGENPDEYKVAFYPWQPLSAERDIPVRSDWIVSISEPIELVKTSYLEKMNGRNSTDGSNPQ